MVAKWNLKWDMYLAVEKGMKYMKLLHRIEGVGCKNVKKYLKWVNEESKWSNT